MEAAAPVSACRSKAIVVVDDDWGRSRISGKGVHMYMYKGVGVHFDDFI